MTIHVLSGCCLGAPMGKSDAEKKIDPRGIYYGCMKCGKYVERADAAYQIRLMRRTVKELGLRLSKTLAA